MPKKRCAGTPYSREKCCLRNSNASGDILQPPWYSPKYKIAQSGRSLTNARNISNTHAPTAPARYSGHDNTKTSNSMRTLQNIFLEIDEKIFGGVYRRFGPFLETTKLIEDLNKSKYKDVVVGIDNLEINYSSFNKIRSDFRKFGISNFFNERHRFKKDFLKLTNNLFSKLIDNHKYIPLEIEIVTFTSWK